MTGKLLIWCIVALLCVAAFMLIVGTFIFRQQKAGLEAEMRKMVTSKDEYTLVAGHNTYVRTWFGGKIEFHPRNWAAVLLGSGLIMVIGALVFLLHVPNPEGPGVE